MYSLIIIMLRLDSYMVREVILDELIGLNIKAMLSTSDDCVLSLMTSDDVMSALKLYISSALCFLIDTVFLTFGVKCHSKMVT